MSDIYRKWVDAIQPILDNQHDYEEIITISDGISTDENYAKWALGDIALIVESKYGEDSLGDFANRIGKNKGTLANQRTLCDFWIPAQRWELVQECQNIRYSHFTHAMRYGKKSCDDSPAEALRVATGFLLECSNNDWSPSMARAEVTKRLGTVKDFLKLEGDYHATMTRDETGIHLIVTQGEIELLEDGATYKIKIFKQNTQVETTS
jgi:hypothetical protein